MLVKQLLTRIALQQKDALENKDKFTPFSDLNSCTVTAFFHSQPLNTGIINLYVYNSREGGVLVLLAEIQLL